ncbi:hypothetical protein [Bradyrhizobium iriomotense]|uniref:hypothetical protein n=1 Tax=Bradyrhizobium iriomotense TaxID=441950 RepID=UPI0024E12AFD|nr:hypothetical protein [Bradyrhizobium iriomotense]
MRRVRFVCAGIVGIDLALWDLHARRKRLPLWRLLGGRSGGINVNESATNPVGTAKTAEVALMRSYRAVNLKVGFDMRQTQGKTRSLRYSHRICLR